MTEFSRLGQQAELNVSDVVEVLGKISDADELPADVSVARTGRTMREADWRDEFFQCPGHFGSL